jgi:hypothetical protein
MKKLVVLLVVVALTCISAMAFAADITVGGQFDIRGRDFVNTSAGPSNPALPDANGTTRDTQERVRLDVNVKAGDDVKAKLEIENDWDTWGRLEEAQGDNNAVSIANGANNKRNNFLDLREAWVSFNLPGLPLNVTGGHQLLQLGNGWFLRNMKYGDDAWVVANVTGANTAAFVDIKAAEVNVAKADDVDAYAFLDMLKLGDGLVVGVDFALAKDRKNALGFAQHPVPATAAPETNLYNLGVNLNGKFGPVALKAEVDQQFGKVKNANLISGATGTWDSGDAKTKGSQIVVQGNVAMDPMTINFTVARGSGAKANQTDYNQFVNFLDKDQHYTFLYEYKVKSAAGGTNTGFTNTTALSAGVSAALAKSLVLSADFWLLRATQAVALNGATDLAGNAATSRKLGTEIDMKVNWQMYENLSWNWSFGYFKAGEAYDTMVNGTPASADKVFGVQNVITLKF